MKIVIAPDSFKGSLSAHEAAMAIKKGLQKVLPDSKIVMVPMADGGEGTLQCLLDATDGKRIQTVVKDPLGRDVQSSLGILGDGVTCVIEMALASGLYLIERQERNPLITTTYGVGQLIKTGLDHGCRTFILGLGGSATNDGGAGMLQALGVELLDISGQPIPFGGGALDRLHHIRIEKMDSRLAESTFLMACDVSNPFVGPAGASVVFGPQKGATPEMVNQLDYNLNHFADCIEEAFGKSIHHVPGAGAAGGLAGAILAFLGGTIGSGVTIVAEAAKLEQHLKDADLIITGEGRVDFQTAQGKTPCGVAQMGNKYGVPTYVLAGSVGTGIENLYQHGVTAVMSIINQPMSLDYAMKHTAELLEQASEQIIRIAAHQLRNR